ncbi:MAG TPA: CHAT domain-containing protein [Streptosporangiaceae bacterium]|nr:CHAT domain-containing protein [Streptosporangiaceae bacterium]
MASDKHAGRGGAGRLRTAIDQASGAWDRYQNVPGTRTRGELVAAWGAVLQPELAGLLAPVMRARVLFNLARALREQVLYEESLPSADRAIAVLEESRTLIPLEEEDWRDATRLLAMVLQDRYELTGGAGDLRQAADRLREVRDHLAETDVVAASVELAACLLALDTAGQPGLDEAIEVLQAAAPSAGLTTTAVAAERAYALGVVLATRFGRSGDAGDARAEFTAFREAVVLSTADGQGTAGGQEAESRYRDGLGSAYFDQWRLTRDPALLGSALAEYGQALDSSPEARAALGIRINIGDALVSRFGLSGDRQDLASALEHLHAAAEGLPDDSRAALSYGAALLDAYQHDGKEQRLAEAIRLLEFASARNPAGSVNYRAAQTSLGNALRIRFARAGDPGDLGRAVDCHRAAVAGLLEGAPDAAVWLAMYGHALHDRYTHGEDERDLAECEEVYARAAVRAADGSEDVILSGQGTVSIERYRRGGDAAYLQAALDLYARALQACPPAAPMRGVYLSDLGTVYRLRYLSTGQLRDLERAIASMDEAIAFTDQESPSWAALLTTRGLLSLDAYNQTGLVAAVSDGISDLTEAVAALSPRAPRRPDCQASLAGALILRAELAALTADIEADDNDVGNAVELLESALSLTSDEAAMRPQYLAALGDARLSRYRQSGDPADLDTAVGLLDQAWRSSGVTGQGGLSDRLARACRLRWTSRCADEDLHRAIEMYDRASRPGPGQGPGQIAEAALEWGRWALDRQAWPEAALAYRRCLESMIVLLAGNAARHHKETWLEPAAEVPSRVAYAYAMAGDPVTAAALFERGRGFLLNETAEWRHRLQEEHPALYARLRDALAAADAMAGAVRTVTPRTLAGPLATGQPERVYQELDEVFTQVESLVSGTGERTGRPASAPGWLLDAWVVRLAPGPRSSIALVSPPAAEEVTVIPLAGAPEAALEERLAVFRAGYEQRQAAPEAWHTALDDVAGWLGREVGRALTEVIPAGADIVLIGGGALGLLPVHAAWLSGTAQGGRRYLLDQVRIRHAPNIASVRRGQAGPGAAHASSVFLVDDPRPSTLPIREARLDQAVLARYFRECVAVRGPDATRLAVLHTITEGGRDVIHLSCHARANVTRPMETAFLLAGDDTMTVRDLFGAPAGRARLGVLAGCETGVAGSSLPDEALGLPTALMAAGVPGVIASAWAIPDHRVTAVLLARFYELWQTAGQPPAEALRQAQRWVRDSTNGEKTTDYPWYGGAYRGHTGGAAHRLWLTARTHQHPYWWAGFTFTGA